MRAVVDFVPKPTSPERLIAGVVTRLNDGMVDFLCAIDPDKMRHAFGIEGEALYHLAYKLCDSLAQHWRIKKDAETWVPPFTTARIAEISSFSAQNSHVAHVSMLNRTSALHTLLNSYELPMVQKEMGIVARIKGAVRRNRNTEHLTKRFNRTLSLGDQAEPLSVDFLGQNYACYFLQITHTARGLGANTERAFGKLYELQALQRFVKKPPKSLGLLDDERPKQFELVMVGDVHDAIQRRAIYQVEALADKGKVIARTLPSASKAAEHVAERERLIA